MHLGPSTPNVLRPTDCVELVEQFSWPSFVLGGICVLALVAVVIGIVATRTPVLKVVSSLGNKDERVVYMANGLAFRRANGCWWNNDSGLRTDTELTVAIAAAVRAYDWEQKELAELLGPGDSG